jgi:RNA polymerase sigma-54 factor
MIHSPALQASAQLAPTLSPRLQRAVRLLQMSSLEFSQLVRQAADTNPFLEVDPEAATTADPQGQDAQDVQVGEDDPGGADAESGEGEMPWGTDTTVRAPRQDASGEAGLDTLAAPSSLAAHLATQLNVLPLPERDRVLALALAYSLDDDGYLRLPLQEAGEAAGLVPGAGPEELAIALRRVQALDPAGVGARDLSECLQLQLVQLVQQVQDPAPTVCTHLHLALRIAREHLPALAACDVAALARRLAAPREAVQAACDAIRRLDPRPGWRHGTHAVNYITPDVVVRRQRGQWVASLNPAVLPRVRLHRRYADWYGRCRDPGHAELGAHLQEARWTLRNVEQRFATILSVARAILQRQHRFLALGPMAMRPLALREIADAVGAHESTISRVTNNKYMATPCGVFELKYFFSRGLATASGGACSPTAIRGLIRELIAAESPRQPLSDVAVAALLARQGLCVARRTVTKYRQQLKIAPAPRRHPSIR